MNILFVTSTRIGDAILSTGLLEYLRAENTEINVTIACGPAAAPLFDEFPGLKQIIVLDKMILSLHWLRLWFLTIGTHWDIVVDLRNAPVTLMLRCRKRYTLPRGGNNNRRVEQIAGVLNLTEVVAPKLWTNEYYDNLAKELLPRGKKILAVGPTANWQAKTWRQEYFAELIERLTSPTGILSDSCVLLMGRDDERPMVQRLIRSIPGDKLVDLIGRIDLLTAYACLRRSAFYIGNDSGLMHLAAASGTPTLGLFGPTKEELYAPWGKNTAVVRTTVPFDNIFPENFEHRTSESLMDSLTVDMAYDAAQALWERTRGKFNG